MTIRIERTDATQLEGKVETAKFLAHELNSLNKAARAPEEGQKSRKPVNVEAIFNKLENLGVMELVRHLKIDGRLE